MRSAAALLLLMIGAGVASADETAPSPLMRPHWEAEVAMVLPLELAHDPGVHVAVGRQIGGFRLAAEYTRGDASIDRPSGFTVMTDSGLSQRLGIAARYRVGMGAPPIGFGAYLEGGLGRDEVTWSRGDSTVARDLMLGLGVEMAGGDERLFGLDVGARFVLGGRETAALFTIGLIAGG